VPNVVDSSGSSGDSAHDFLAEIDALRDASFPSDITIVETPAPKRLAPEGIALTADLDDDLNPDADESLASGRLVLLHDPSSPEEWVGTTRAVLFLRATVEPEVADDPMLTDVAWSWLEESLERHGAEPREMSGTVTRTSSDTFGGIADTEAPGAVEIRASWTPDGPLIAQVRAWIDLLRVTAGQPLLPVAVSPLRPRLQ
jgi:hypothetical protein